MIEAITPHRENTVPTPLHSPQPPKTMLVVALATAIAAPPVMYLEGRALPAYLDIVGVPTICYGSTAGVKLGQTKTDAECTELLRGELGKTVEQVTRLIKTQQPATRIAALSSFAYNVGIGAFSKSTLLKKLNAGQIMAACAELDRWVYAGKKRVEGLVKRRFVERTLCEWSAEDDDIRTASAWVYQVINVPLSPTRHAALTAYAYNIGFANFQTSPVVQQLNAGKGATACRAIMLWPAIRTDGERKRRAVLQQMCEVKA
ncbi:glycoside hydrolase family protein [Aeromonas veronii]|uniref:glycoside hydrolase family protein n=1 Tax=Aeromonas veronii TaxID=654 RepID=UPI003D247173